MSPEGFVQSSGQIERLNRWIKTEGGVAPFKRTEGVVSGVIDFGRDYYRWVRDTTQPLNADIYLIGDAPLIVCGDKAHADLKTIYCGNELAKRLEKAGIAVFPKTPEEEKINNLISSASCSEMIVTGAERVSGPEDVSDI